MEKLLKVIQQLNFLFLFFIVLASCEDKVRKKAASTGIYKSDISLAEGKQLFFQYCASCHGEKGEATLNGVKSLASHNKGSKQIITRIVEGKRNMPAFKDILSDQQVIEVASYVITQQTPD